MLKLLVLCILFICVVPVQFEVLEIQQQKMVFVEVKGHVEQPGTYEFQKGTTLEECLKTAGLFSDSDLRSLNLTSILHNHDVIVVPVYKETLISINSASLEELMTLPGIGEKTARNILEYRQNAPFQSLDDLLNVKGIGQKKYEDLIGYIGL